MYVAILGLLVLSQANAKVPALTESGKRDACALVTNELVAQTNNKFERRRISKCTVVPFDSKSETPGYNVDLEVKDNGCRYRMPVFIFEKRLGGGNPLAQSCAGSPWKMPDGDNGIIVIPPPKK
jgi:hypothetical protein